ncbi:MULTISPECIES: hypothetical protein [unclassified Stenotrophomonas]|uniref:hypothetical protein n=1 Tax=unclassified Stenotrophomonas TaxID=196198 RepID=UPI0034675E6F
MSNDKTLATVKHGGCVQLGTPGSRWAASGEPDPHGTRYDCERAALVMGDLTDDELANAVFMHGNERQTMADLVGGATPAIAYLTAAKDRIRWLSRALAAAESLSAQPSPGGQDASGLIQDLRAAVSLGRPLLHSDVDEIAAALAARQPVGEPVAHEYTFTGMGKRDAVAHVGPEFTPVAPKGMQLAAVRPLYAAPTAQQSAQAVAADGFWLAVDDDGFVHFGQSTDDGNGGVGVRENVESRINDWLDNDGRSVDLVWAGSAPAPVVDLSKSLPLIARVLAEWHEDDGNVLWWAWCGREWAGEPAWCGTPNDSDWPGYHTHWTPHPSQPALLDRQAVGK